MRRRRRPLQVSTFPFLAVLLCAMGVLLLLLLVIDRRAKVVARAKALHLVAQVEGETKRLLAEKQAERARERQAETARLTLEHDQLQQQVQSQAGAESRLVADLLQSQQRRDGLRLDIDAFVAQLGESGRQVGARKVETQTTMKHVTKAEHELARQQAELAQLEQLTQKLKDKRREEQRTYSLIPYRGQRGEHRRPLYVECVGAGLIFHPERSSFPRSSAVSEVRAEIERRLAQLAKASTDKAAPYVYLLVRPDGIVSHYLAQSALDGLKVDYGYELVERDWVLDFSDSERPAQQPWIAAAPKGEIRIPTPPSAPGTPGHAGGNSPPHEAKSAMPGTASPGDVIRAPSTAGAPKLLPPVGPRDSAHSPREPQDPLPPLLAPPDGDRPTRQPPISRPTGNRDWLIVLECKRDMLILLPTGQRFDPATLEAKAPAQPPLVTAVRQLIEKRQATVRLGEPPYRPLLRFRVHANALGTYYLAYPLLERLALPMSRENVE